MRVDLLERMSDVTCAAALLAAVLLWGCASQTATEDYDVAQCQALGGSVVRETVDSSVRQGFRIEKQRCAFPGRSTQGP